MALTFTSPQEVTKRCRLSWLTNSALVYEPICGGRGGLAGSQPMSTAVHRSPNKLWRSNSVFNLWVLTNPSNITQRAVYRSPNKRWRSNSIFNLGYGFNLHLTTGGHKEKSSILADQ